MIDQRFTSENGFKVDGATCVALNLDAFGEYAPDFCKQFSWDALRIGEWLSRECGCLSESQFNFHLDQGDFECQMEEGAIHEVTFFRQSRMERACLIECNNYKPEALVFDLKGIGVREGKVPAECDHGTGLLSLERAAREFLVGSILNRVFGRSLDWKPVKVLAIIRLPLSYSLHGREITPCVLVREPTIRCPLSDLPPALSEQWERAIDAELDLRTIGLSTAMNVPLSIMSAQGGELVSNELERSSFSSVALQEIVLRLNLKLPINLYKCNTQLNRSFSKENEWILVDFEQVIHLQWLRNHFSFCLSRDRHFCFAGLLPRVCEEPLMESSLVSFIENLWLPAKPSFLGDKFIQNPETVGGVTYPYFIVDLANQFGILKRRYRGDSEGILSGLRKWFDSQLRSLEHAWEQATEYKKD